MDVDPDPAGTIYIFAALLGLLIIDAILSALEEAMDYVNRGKLSILCNEGNKKASRLLKILEEPRSYVRSLFISRRFLEFLMVALLLISLNFRDLILLIYVIPATYLIIVIANIYPQKLAWKSPEKTLLKFQILLSFVNFIAKPFVWLSYKTAGLFLLMAGHKPIDQEDEFSEEEIINMIEAGASSGELKEEGKKMITAIFAFDDKLAYEIMKARTDVFTIDINGDIKQYMTELADMRFSRIPVYEGDTDNIIGILFLKDLMQQAMFCDIQNVDLRPLLRPPLFVPETKNVDALFLELKTSKNHMAILIDEYGGFSGIVTMEDIIEEIVGEIEDEYDLPEKGIEVINDNLFLSEGAVSLDDINEKLGTNFSSEDSETLGGYLIEQLGEIPKEGQKNIEILEGGFKITIISVKDKRVERVRLERLTS